MKLQLSGKVNLPMLSQNDIHGSRNLSSFEDIHFKFLHEKKNHHFVILYLTKLYRQLSITKRLHKFLLKHFKAPNSYEECSSQIVRSQISLSICCSIYAFPIPACQHLSVGLTVWSLHHQFAWSLMNVASMEYIM